MCVKAVYIRPFVVNSVHDEYKTQEMCDKAAFEDLFMLHDCLDRYETQEKSDKAVDGYLPVLKLVFDLFVTSKMVKNVIMFYSQMTDDNVTFSSDEMGILSVDLNNINLGDVNFYEDDPETIIHVTLMAWHNRPKKREAFKKDISKEKDIMPVARCLRRWWHWCMSKDEEKTFTYKN